MSDVVEAQLELLREEIRAEFAAMKGAPAASPAVNIDVQRLAAEVAAHLPNITDVGQDVGRIGKEVRTLVRDVARTRDAMRQRGIIVSRPMAATIGMMAVLGILGAFVGGWQLSHDAEQSVFRADAEMVWSQWREPITRCMQGSLRSGAPVLCQFPVSMAPK